MKKLKVLMVAGTMNVGGQENQIMNVLRYVDKEQFQIDFTSTMENAYYRSEIEELGGRFILIPEIKWKHPQDYCRALYKIMKDGHYDIVHSHELFHSGITLLIAAKAGIPCRIAHSHSGSDGNGRHRSMMRKIYNTVMRKLILRYSTVRIACSSIAGSFLYGEKAIREPGYHLVFNSVDTQKFMEHFGKKGNLCEDETWHSVLHVGHVIPTKNQEFLVEIAKILQKRGKKIHIFCVGPGNEDYIEFLEHKIAENHLEQQITLLGLRADVPELMSKADAFVLPSLYEGMPLVMIEAQASGLPCVAADTFSKEVDFNLGMVNWMALQDGAEAWADAIEKAITIGRANKKEVVQAIDEKKFDSRKFAEEICIIYKEAFGTEK